MTVDILKLDYNNELGSPSFVIVGNWSEGNYYDGNTDGLQMLDRALLTNEKPEINKTLIVTTMPGSSCMIKSEITGEEEGFCVDLADHLSKLLGFYYKFKTVSDGHYGKPDPMTGQWDGMIGEVMRGVRRQIIVITSLLVHSRVVFMRRTRIFCVIDRQHRA